MTDLAATLLSLIPAAALLIAAISIVYASWRNGISPMPTSAKVRRAVSAEVDRLGPGDGRFLVEAGSGWGTLALNLARRSPGWRIVGIENSVVPLVVSKLIPKPARTSIAFIRGDLYVYDYKTADLVVCYLYPGAMKRLSPILREQLRPGAHVISVCFALPDWQPERTVTCSDLYRTPVYIYRIPDKEPFPG
jgi:hypothetical protein